MLEGQGKVLGKRLLKGRSGSEHSVLCWWCLTTLWFQCVCPTILITWPAHFPWISMHVSLSEAQPWLGRRMGLSGAAVPFAGATVPFPPGPDGPEALPSNSILSAIYVVKFSLVIWLLIFIFIFYFSIRLYRIFDSLYINLSIGFVSQSARFDFESIYSSLTRPSCIESRL